MKRVFGTFKLTRAFYSTNTPNCATPSEAAVKADRASMSMDEMRQKTVNDAKHDPNGERTHAAYAREEVNGPLGHAGVGEFEGVVGNDDLGPDNAQVEPDGRVVSRNKDQAKG